MQRSAGIDDLAGPDVILVHRLLKNSVSERLGLRAYALLTEALLSAFDPRPPLTENVETIESFGAVVTYVEDLKPVAAGQRAARRIRVEPDNADLDATMTMGVPPPVAWDWWMTPERVLQWDHGLTGFEMVANKDGRAGMGAENHCAHGKGLAVQRFLDVRPFEYVTKEVTPVKRSFSTPPACTFTLVFTPVGDGASTSVQFLARLSNRGLGTRLATVPMRKMFERTFRTSESRLAELLKAQAPAGLEERAVS